MWRRVLILGHMSDVSYQLEVELLKVELMLLLSGNKGQPRIHSHLRQKQTSFRFLASFKIQIVR